MNKDGTLLNVDNLQVSFFTPVGEVRAVDGISYSLKYGEIMGIVGESGSGKSVEAYSIMGLIESPGKVKGGVIEFEGVNLLSLTEEEHSRLRGNRISMIFQNPLSSLNPVYTIEEQLCDVLFAHKKENAREGEAFVTRKSAQERALEMLRLVGITNPESRLKQYPHELSGGMRQRIMIAMSLICNPALLIADEPTTALDVTIQAQILDLLKRIQAKTKMSIIFITHNLAVVAELCDIVSVMYGGHLVEQGTVDDIFYSPMHPYTKGLLRSMPRLDEESGRLIPIAGTPINMLEPNPGCPFAPRCDECMNICVRENPVSTLAGGAGAPADTEREGENGRIQHKASCWLLHKGEARARQQGAH